LLPLDYTRGALVELAPKPHKPQETRNKARSSFGLRPSSGRLRLVPVPCGGLRAAGRHCGLLCAVAPTNNNQAAPPITKPAPRAPPCSLLLAPAPGLRGGPAAPGPALCPCQALRCQLPTPTTCWTFNSTQTTANGQFTAFDSVSIAVPHCSRGALPGGICAYATVVQPSAFSAQREPTPD
jgi:hypothetical protein